jgi:hypothetical protein
MQYLKKSRVNSRTRPGRSIIVETSFEEIARKYRQVKAGKTKIDLLCLKSEIESYIRNRQGVKRKGDDLVAEAQDMLMDVTQMIEEGHCNPFRPKKL